jgi:hypothetical protein
MYVTAADGLYIRAQPNTSAKVVGNARLGDRVSATSENPEQITINGHNGRWTRVRFGEIEGWAFGGFLSDSPPGGAAAQFQSEPRPVLPPLPVVVTLRTSAVGKGYVAQFHNTSGKYLQVIAEFRNPTLNRQQSFVVSLQPWVTQEFGWQEGWEFSSGELIRVYHADYQPVLVKIE